MLWIMNFLIAGTQRADSILWRSDGWTWSHWGQSKRYSRQIQELRQCQLQLHQLWQTVLWGTAPQVQYGNCQQSETWGTRRQRCITGKQQNHVDTKFYKNLGNTYLPIFLIESVKYLHVPCDTPCQLVTHDVTWVAGTTGCHVQQVICMLTLIKPFNLSLFLVMINK